MCAILGTTHYRPDVPYDCADFGRCYRMLQRFPELRNEIRKVSDIHKQWIPFIDCWKQLEALYEDALCWWDLPENEQKKQKRRKNFISPAQELYNHLNTCVSIGRYMNGMRFQNSVYSLRGEAPETV